MMDATNGNAAAAAAQLSASFNNNSFGLGPTILGDKDGKDGAKLDVEVAENLVGAILGPGGKVRRFCGKKNDAQRATRNVFSR